MKKLFNSKNGASNLKKGYLVFKGITTVIVLIFMVNFLTTGKIPFTNANNSSADVEAVKQQMENMVNDYNRVSLPKESTYMSVDEAGNVSVNVKDIVENWSNHPFHNSVDEFFVEEQKEINAINSAFEDGRISEEDYKAVSLEFVSIYDKVFFDSKLKVNEYRSIATLTFSKDVRLGILALDFYESHSSETLYQVIAFDAYIGANELQGLSPEQVKEKIFDHFNNVLN